MGTNGRSNHRPGSGDDIENAGRHTGLRRKLSHSKGAHAGFARRFDDDAVSGGKRRCSLPRHHLEREVPGHDAGNHTNRLPYDQPHRIVVGRRNLIAVPTDEHNRIRVDKLRSACAQVAADGGKVLAIIGVAGTTETGHIDPLNELADVAAEISAHFHVDAAWGGATLMSSNYRHLLAGIERADSVTIDAHKQMYVPMGAGMVLFRDPSMVRAIEHHAEYVIRHGSKDLGAHTMEGSRSGMAMMVYSALQVMGRQGFELLIDQSIEKAKLFAALIAEQDDFE